MEYFKSGLKSVLGAPQPGAQPTGAETVERLVNRVVTSTLLEDRRDACRALRALSRKYRLEVGAQGMNALCQILELDRTDCEIISYSLDTLCNITSKEVFEEENEYSTQENVNVGEQFTEMFLKNTENVTLVLGFLEEYDFKVRWPAVKFLTSLLASKPKEIQDIILVSPMGVSKLMDLLLESREVIRNDALLLLIQLTKSNANIQKIVAFENAFDRLFDVISQEGHTDGGIVVEDCLLIMLNLLKNNTSNINFFKEGSYVQKLAPMFILPKNIEEIGWSPQKVSNFHCILQVIRTLVAPSNPVQIISACQKAMRNANLLEALSNILMALGVPADILSETINTVAEVIRGNLTNQEYFANVMAPSDPPRPAIVVLLMSMVNEKQPFSLRCAVSYCFQCFLYKNEISQAQVVQTLLPSSSGGSVGLTTGQLLCSGLFSSDSLSIWFSSVALSHTLIENPAQKEQLLRVLIATNVGVQPVSLLHQCATYLQQTSKLQAKLGILMLLSMWLSHCPSAVQVFLNVPGAMAFLTAQTSANEYDNNEELLQGLCAFIMGLCVVFNDNTVQNYNKENLSQLIEKRVGVETYLGKLGEISRHEVYSKAAKQPQLRAKHSGELLLEYEFCKLFKVLENVIINALGVQRQLTNGNITELSLSEHENALLLQYKDVIRDQDRRLSDMQRQIEYLREEKQHLNNQLEDLQQTNLQLQDQNTLLKAQLLTGATIVNNIPPADQNPPDKQQYHDQNDLIDKLKCIEMENREKQSEIDSLKKDQDDLLELLTDQEVKLNTFKNRLIELGETIEDDAESDNISVGSEN
ncbi:putative protein transporter [Trypoxylus dichotomus]